jgi:protein involved in sex pheromone biosynthesis
MMRRTIVVVATAVVFALAGCVTYSGDTLRSLGDRNLSASEITIEMCRDFALASQAAIHGDDYAFYVLGKASEMRGLSVGLSKHSIQCFSAVERLAREENPMSEFHHGALLQIFKRSWSNSKVLAGETE